MTFEHKDEEEYSPPPLSLDAEYTPPPFLDVSDEYNEENEIKIITPTPAKSTVRNPIAFDMKELSRAISLLDELADLAKKAKVNKNFMEQWNKNYDTILRRAHQVTSDEDMDEIDQEYSHFISRLVYEIEFFKTQLAQD